MGLCITELAEELKDIVSWQKTPFVLTDEDFLKMILHSLKRLYIDTNRVSSYDETLFITEDDKLYYNVELPINEVEYIMICARIAFFKRVQTDVNDSFSYTTDALTVTNADKPYANLKDTISELERDRRIIYYKMVLYSLGE